MNLLDFNNHIWHLLLIIPGKAKHDAATPGWPAMMYRVKQRSKHDLPSPRAGMPQVQPTEAYTLLYLLSIMMFLFSEQTRQKKKKKKHQWQLFKEGLHLLAAANLIPVSVSMPSGKQMTRFCGEENWLIPYTVVQ